MSPVALRSLSTANSGHSYTSLHPSSMAHINPGTLSKDPRRGFRILFNIIFYPTRIGLGENLLAILPGSSGPWSSRPHCTLFLGHRLPGSLGSLAPLKGSGQESLSGSSLVPLRSPWSCPPGHWAAMDRTSCSYFSPI